MFSPKMCMVLNQCNRQYRKLLFSKLGIKGTKIPKTLSGKFEIEGTQYTLHQSAVTSRAHRLFVTCPECQKMFPVGRLHQHAKVHAIPKSVKESI